MAVPMSRAFREKHDGEESLIPIPPAVRGKKIREVQILPKRDGSCIDAVFVYEELDAQKLKLHRSNVLSMEPCPDNSITGVCTDGTTFIMDGRKIKSIDQWYNKLKAK